MLVFKTARVARLIPPSAVVEISSKINFYWYVERISPSWYWRKYRERVERAQREKQELEARSGAHLLKRASWGGLEIAALAAVKALARQREMEREENKRSFGLRKWTKKAKRAFGMLPSTAVEVGRHIAATKIQRAWRNRLARPTEARSEDGIGTGSVEDDSWRKKRPKLGTSFQRQNAKHLNGSKVGHRTSDKKSMVAFRGPNFKDKRADSQVGSAMAEVTGQRVATIILLSLLLTILFTYHEPDTSRPSTMVVLHGQTVESASRDTASKALYAATNSSIALLFDYQVDSSSNTTDLNFTFPVDEDIDSLRQREKLRIFVKDSRGTTEGLFVYRQERVDESTVELAATFFVLLVWFLGVTAFAGPIMTLVIIPIERMVRLLGMLMVDPLGYQSNLRFKKFMVEEDAIAKRSQWTKEVLKGMETSFLMTTILRIGSLMRVGFGSAGVEIIRNNLQKGQNKNLLILNSQGSTVACIFLFCDIRQFTDATECLQEEVFVFTNRIAAVVHSICHSYGGSANKNVGDAFLVSWLLEDESSGNVRSFNPGSSQTLVARQNQADKALLSVVKICMALHFDNYYVETMSENARTALLNKLKNRPGPIVQMGFGLHAGKAVQGAIGSQRKIDATYVSEAVERAEFLESSTKQYGLKMLMSDDFHRLLHPNNRRRCRKIDQIIFRNEDDDADSLDEADGIGDVMELYTYDLDINALWRGKKQNVATAADVVDSSSENESSMTSSGRDGRGLVANQSSRQSKRKKGRRLSSMKVFEKGHISSDDLRSGSLTMSSEAGFNMAAAAKAVASEVTGSTFFEVDDSKEAAGPTELVLPSGPALYSQNLWMQGDMRRVRHQYTAAIFHSFSSGLKRYYEGDWTGARQYFESILEHFEDGPSLYFLAQMKKHNWKPPRDFQGYGRA